MELYYDCVVWVLAKGEDLVEEVAGFVDQRHLVALEGWGSFEGVLLFMF